MSRTQIVKRQFKRYGNKKTDLCITKKDSSVMQLFVSLKKIQDIITLLSDALYLKEGRNCNITLQGIFLSWTLTNLCVNGQISSTPEKSTNRDKQYMENNKPTCFVIQEFDDGDTFDRRYEETISPALIAAEVAPRRADEILGLQPVINKIEDAIQQASICVAEVSTDKSNVWLELGYALAVNRPVVILCDDQKRVKLPFDIQHRPVYFINLTQKVVMKN